MTFGVPVPSPVDAEPGRCRRTDGQKWRCRLAVLPDKKYCERHVNRGRQRSRKHVEADQSVSKSKPTAMTPISSMKGTPNLGFAAKTNAVKHTKVGINDLSFKINKPGKESCASHEIGIFPESVLQHDKVRSCETSSSVHNSALAVAESTRCRRSDGKNWRCSRRALPDQKYCMQHMHRGTKKAENGQKSNTSLPFEMGAGSDQISSSSSDGNGGHPNGAVTRGSSDATAIST